MPHGYESNRRFDSTIRQPGSSGSSPRRQTAKHFIRCDQMHRLPPLRTGLQGLERSSTHDALRIVEHQLDPHGAAVPRRTPPPMAPNSCMDCDFPACAAVCPVEAITKYEEGPVVINQQTCIGCEYCIHACPWDVISKDDITSKASKCTMCSDRISEDKQPFCVQACPVDALDFGFTEEIADKAKKQAEAVGG